MVTFCFAVVALYFMIVLIDDWHTMSYDAAVARVFSVTLLVITIIGITAANGGFTFPTDFREIRQRIVTKE